MASDPSIAALEKRISMLEAEVEALSPVAEMGANLRRVLLNERPPEKLLINADEAAQLLGMSRASFYRGLSRGTIPPALKTDGGPRWRREDLIEHVRSLKPAVTAEETDRAD